MHDFYNKIQMREVSRAGIKECERRIKHDQHRLKVDQGQQGQQQPRLIASLPIPHVLVQVDPLLDLLRREACHGRYLYWHWHWHWRRCWRWCEVQVGRVYVMEWGR